MNAKKNEWIKMNRKITIVLKICTNICTTKPVAYAFYVCKYITTFLKPQK